MAVVGSHSRSAPLNQAERLAAQEHSEIAAQANFGRYMAHGTHLGDISRRAMAAAWVDDWVVLSWNGTVCEGRFLVWNGSVLAAVIHVDGASYDAAFDAPGTWLVQGATLDGRLMSLPEHGVNVTVEVPHPESTTGMKPARLSGRQGRTLQLYFRESHA